jgi:hypothetical protein
MSTIKTALFVFLVMVVLTGSFPALTHANTVIFPGPKRIGLTGTFYIPGQEPIVTRNFDLRVGSTEWVYHVQSTRDMGWGNYLSAWGLMNHVFPPVLYVRTSPEFSSVLQRSDLAGKQVTIVGFLYSGLRVFHVTEVQVAE